jgi:hypothetical protein
MSLGKRRRRRRRRKKSESARSLFVPRTHGAYGIYNVV